MAFRDGPDDEALMGAWTAFCAQLQAAEEVGPQELVQLVVLVQLVRVGRHRVTPISSRMTRRLRTA